MAVEGYTADQVLEMLNKKLRGNKAAPTFNARPVKRVPNKILDSFHEQSTKWQEQREDHISKLRIQLEAKEAENKTPRRKPDTPPGYVGPISGWNDHYQAFIERRTRQVKEFSFSPAIDQKSKEMMNTSASFYDRVKYWNDKKMKHAEERRSPLTTRTRTPTPIDPIKRGCEMHDSAIKLMERRAVAAEAVIKSMCPFKPQINPLSSELAAIARLKQRSKSPPSQLATQSTIDLQQERKLTRSSFNKFLERNYTSPLSRSKSPALTSRTPTTNYDCTFSPSILDRSRDMSPTGDLYSRAKYLEVKKSAKLDNLREENLKREKSDCTFQPKLITKTSSQSSSTTTVSTCADALSCVYRDAEGSQRVLDVYSYGDLEVMGKVDDIEARLVI
mmetsp:Transcript_29829/g.53050  ORF Transcript_29829/g.53050 Transcript_29829/m.53050 type:complete len:389 (-) Transcript_29829:402-1568(-)